MSALASKPAVASDDMYTEIGASNKPCGFWTISRPMIDGEDTFAMQQWILGYLSGFGFSGAGNPLADLHAKAVFLWVDNYCQENRSANLHDVVAAFIRSHSKPSAYHTDIGKGVESCGTWTADRRIDYGRSILGDEQWVLGYLSGFGFSGVHDPLNHLDAEAVYGWVDNFCRENPLKRMIDAADALIYNHPD
jgi:hypothetical protein